MKNFKYMLQAKYYNKEKKEHHRVDILTFCEMDASMETLIEKLFIYIQITLKPL